MSGEEGKEGELGYLWRKSTGKKKERRMNIAVETNGGG